MIAKIIRKIFCLLSYELLVHKIPDLARKDIILTFDDGPDPINTQKVLKLLKKHHIRAIFFVVGKSVHDNKLLFLQMIKDGHLIGNHTYSHKNLKSLGDEEVSGEIVRCQDIISEFSYNKFSLFRPPWGMMSIGNTLFLLKHKFSIILWTVDSKEHSSCNCVDIIGRLRTTVKKRSVVLFHDDNPLCSEILEDLIPYWQSIGMIL